MFLQVLSEHTSLRRLEFKSADNKISGHLFKAILQSCPPTLDTLDLKWSIAIQDDNDFECRDSHVTLPGWTNYGIKTLELNNALTGYEHSVVIPFLRLFLTSTLREYCPALRSLLISNQDHDSVIASLADGCRKLDKFQIRYYGIVGSELISSLVARHKPHTLTLQGPWICLGLQCLELPPGSDFGITVMEDDDDKGRRRQEIINKAYKQLGALKELRELSFGFQVPKENSCRFLLDSEGRKDFDMTLASGLDHLKDLNRLMRLDVERLRHRMREKELRWIDESWSELGEIRGIYTYEGEELSEDEDMDEEDEGEDDEEGSVNDEGGEDDDSDTDGDEDDQLDDPEGAESSLEPAEEGQPEEGKMTRHHVKWFLRRRPDTSLY
ncbi:hypothetical protein BGX23_004886 [Mortierella sp. AD031]|nr:hypothetical protein BGX23_004886 [Mortierella sp. AD031]